MTSTMFGAGASHLVSAGDGIRPGAVQPVCLFAHHDRDGRIRPHVLHYLGALAAFGYRVVLASSGTAPLPADVAAAKRAGADQVVARENAGLDFGAWQHLLRQGHADGAPGILLANDSVFGPFWDLAETAGRVRDRGGPRLDAWGMVESIQGIRHLQSWFVHMEAALFNSPAVRRVFDQPFAQMTKEEVIIHGELGLGVALRAEGAAVGSAFSQMDASRVARVFPTNPTHLDWRALLTRRLVPFLKTELLRLNPMRIPWVNEWPGVVAGFGGFQPEWIHEQLWAQSGLERQPPQAPFRSPTAPTDLLTRTVYAALRSDGPMAVRVPRVLRRAKGGARGS